MISIPGLDYCGLLYRALNPVFAREPLSGEGVCRHGGHLNARGTPAFYLACSPTRALREANQIVTLQPTTLVAYRTDLTGLMDRRNAAALTSWDTTPNDMSDPTWRHLMLTGEPVPTRDFAGRLVAAGHPGLIALPFARRATMTEINLVLWRWNTGEDDRLVAVDDEGRLE